MEHVKEGWEDLAHPTSRYHVWECILEQQLLHRWPQVMPHMTGGQDKVNTGVIHFQSPLFLLLAPKCLSATVCITYSSHM